MRTRTDDVLAILQKCFHPREEGWLWLATYLVDAEGGRVSQFEGAYEHPTATAHGVADIVNGCGAERAYLAACRRDGRPTKGDRELWHELRPRVGPELLIDMVVFHRDEARSMRAEDAAATSVSGGRGGS